MVLLRNIFWKVEKKVLHPQRHGIHLEAETQATQASLALLRDGLKYGHRQVARDASQRQDPCSAHALFYMRAE